MKLAKSLSSTWSSPIARLPSIGEKPVQRPGVVVCQFTGQFRLVNTNLNPRNYIPSQAVTRVSRCNKILTISPHRSPSSSSSYIVASSSLAYPRKMRIATPLLRLKFARVYASRSANNGTMTRLAHHLAQRKVKRPDRGTRWKFTREPARVLFPVSGEGPPFFPIPKGNALENLVFRSGNCFEEDDGFHNPLERRSE